MYGAVFVLCLSLSSFGLAEAALLLRPRAESTDRPNRTKPSRVQQRVPWYEARRRASAEDEHPPMCASRDPSPFEGCVV